MKKSLTILAILILLLVGCGATTEKDINYSEKNNEGGRTSCLSEMPSPTT